MLRTPEVSDLREYLSDNFEKCALEVLAAPTGMHWIITESNDGSTRALAAMMIHEDELCDLFGSQVCQDIKDHIKFKGVAKLSLWIEVD